MNKILLVISREYLTRVRKKSFIIMTIVCPLLFAGLMLAPVIMATLEDKEVKEIGIIEIDDFNQSLSRSVLKYDELIKNTEKLKFTYMSNIEMDQVEDLVAHTDIYGILVLNHGVLFSGKEVVAELYAKKQPSMGIDAYISQSLEKIIEDEKLLKYNISPQILKSTNTNVKLKTRKLENGKFEESASSKLNLAVGYAMGFLIYMFIFMFGSQVMRGVIEEKTNRILEVIVTSIKPFQLMMGKIAGIGLVGLTQFMIWVVLTFSLYSLVSTQIIGADLQKQMQESSQPANLFGGEATQSVMPENPLTNTETLSLISEIEQLPFAKIITSFLFFFIFGYLLYGALFAAIGSAADSETDTQQFMFPVTIPLIIGIIVMINAITNPEGGIAYWFSMIPFTSPIVMMARVPFDTPGLQIIISLAILAVTFVLMTWLAGKIYRTGILMYGKKVTFKELIKWVRYKA